MHGDEEEVAVVEEREPLGGARRDEPIPCLRRLDAEDLEVERIELGVERVPTGGGQDVLELQERGEDRKADA